MNPSPNVSDRERAILAFIQTSWDERGYAPALRDIAAHLQTSTSVASYHVTHMERKDWLYVPRMDTGEIITHTMRLTAQAQALLNASPARLEEI